ncbi:hypothetical protein FA13DRAFT_1790435 [Coprinellus micaceus]|uniref:Uncharacterized protein n=1 Tax=Coprinellus micaceus TaxID=71717 RepID=A0A4Y7TFH8_COPMI|nr:hypothetical protein FA13DRAFT_1790435 [Coprinellus micaceus]
MPFTFVLGKSALLFIPPSPDKPSPYSTSDDPFPYPLPSVVQVIVKAAQEYPEEETRAFGVVKEEVTKAIITFLAATRGEKVVPEQLVIEGQGFLLHGSRKEWALAPRLELFWGEVPIQCSRWKWRFIFQLLQ